MIKFRVWDKEHKRMLNIETLALSFSPKGVLTSIYTYGPDFSNDPEIIGDDEPDLDSVILEQFTGLTDVNGKEIYEGDIIQYSDHFYEYSIGGATDREAEYIGNVVKNNGAFGILINRISNTDAHINHYNAKEFVPFCEFEDPEADVLLKGNVHANPELLEEEK